MGFCRKILRIISTDGLKFLLPTVMDQAIRAVVCKPSNTKILTCTLEAATTQYRDLAIYKQIMVYTQKRRR